MKTKPTIYTKDGGHTVALITRAGGVQIRVKLDTDTAHVLKELGDLHVREDVNGRLNAYCTLLREDKTGEVRLMPEKISKIILGAGRGDAVVHLNGDYLDCRAANMRLIGRGDAITEARKAKNPLMGTGITRRGELYRAQCIYGSMRYTLGLFETPERAQEAIDAAMNVLVKATRVLDAKSLRSAIGIKTVAKKGGKK